jgi:hypothetical protein
VTVGDRSEEERNRRLRRIDWRFLLPNPSPNRVLCLANGALREAANALSAQVFGRERLTEGDFDLVVAVDPSVSELASLYAAVAADGAIYAEFRTPRAGGAKLLAGRFAAAGFSEIRVYWPWPWISFLPARFWIPLGAPGAWRWITSGEAPTRSPVRGIRGMALHAAFRVALRLPVKVPLVLVGAKRPAGPSLPGESSLPEDLQRGLQLPANIGTAEAGARVSWTLLAPGPRPVNKLIGMAIAEPSGAPVAVVKIARTEDAAAGLRREASVLSAIHLRQKQHPLPGIPRLLFNGCVGRFEVVAETPLSGRSLSQLATSERFESLARLGTDWLVTFALPRRPRSADETRDRIATPILETFARHFGAVADTGMLNATRDVLSRVSALPAVDEQRDFGPWNLALGADGSLCVYDWESAVLDGAPLLDLLYFLSYLSFFADGALRSKRFRESYRALISRATRRSEVRREAIRRYADALGLSDMDVHALRLLLWMAHAPSEFRHLSADAGGEPTSEALRRAVFLSLWEEEVRAGPER